MVQRKIRESCFDFIEGWKIKSLQTDINGNSLDSELCDFNTVAKNNYKLYKDGYAQEGYGTRELMPVFITSKQRAEYELIENKTIETKMLLLLLMIN